MKKDFYSSNEYFEKLDCYFRAANYLSAAQLYLVQNPLLRDHELETSDLKKRFIGHWGTVPGQNFIYAHCDRIIKKYDADMLLLSGPGHGGNFLVANSYLEGVYSEVYPDISQDKKGMTKLCKQFSFPGGIGSHCVPETPGSMHEGGELGYSLAHAYGAVFDNPNLIAVPIVGDGEAETGPIATSWHLNKFINPKGDGAVLPILHMNGYKISGPTVLSRLEKYELKELFEGYGYEVLFVEGFEPHKMHKLMAKAMDYAIEKIRKIQKHAREDGVTDRAMWPMIVLKTPKGWTCPKTVENKQIEGSFRAHQIPVFLTKPENFDIIKNWLESYKADELFDENYRLKKEIADILPKGKKRLSASVYANGGNLLKELKTPNLNKFAVEFKKRGSVKAQDMLELSGYIAELFKLNAKNKNYRIFSPDEATSNRLYKALEVEKRTFNASRKDSDERLAVDGRIMDSYLSEHVCEGLLEGYLLTGRHGMFDSYESFIRVVDSMVAQHAKWLKVCHEIEWRAPISSLNIVLTSDVWQQDHNGFTHQDPGFIDHVTNKKPYVCRTYLPVDANTLIATYDMCAKSKDFVNTIVASKQPSYQWLSMSEAIKEVEAGISEWTWAGVGDIKNPDIVLACAGHAQTEEALACVKLIKQFLPKLNVKFVNVLELSKLDSRDENPYSLSDAEFDRIFTKDKPVLFNFHGYPQVVKGLVYDRNNKNFVVCGYEEEGTITTSFDMKFRNGTDRFSLLLKVLDLVEVDKTEKAKALKFAKDRIEKHQNYIVENGVDLDEIANWSWND